MIEMYYCIIYLWVSLFLCATVKYGCNIIDIVLHCHISRLFIKQGKKVVSERLFDGFVEEQWQVITKATHSRTHTFFDFISFLQDIFSFAPTFCIFVIVKISDLLSIIKWLTGAQFWFVIHIFPFQSFVIDICIFYTGI